MTLFLQELFQKRKSIVLLIVYVFQLRTIRYEKVDHVMIAKINFKGFFICNNEEPDTMFRYAYLQEAHYAHSNIFF